VARALIVGCGCRGRELGALLREREWEVRGTSRSAEGMAAIEAAGLKAAAADPESPGTVLELCGDVTVVVWLLGSASGEPEAIAAIHGPRLERLLEKLVDSPVRGFAYEASGGVEESRLRGGRGIVERAAETWRIPVVALEGDRGADSWAERTASAVTRLLAG
jgi:nucleoside-diphosphate-sugar epimerase